MRDVYETPESLDNEARLRKKFEQACGVVTKKMPRRYYLDCLVVKDGKAVAVAEFKCRNIKRGDFPTYMISAEKFVRGVELAERLNLGFYIVVQFADGDCWLYSWHKEDEIIPKWGGRTVRRRDNDDVEPIVEIPYKYFKALETK